jgi:hypothetical protein
MHRAFTAQDQGCTAKRGTKTKMPNQDTACDFPSSFAKKIIVGMVERAGIVADGIDKDHRNVHAMTLSRMWNCYGGKSTEGVDVEGELNIAVLAHDDDLIVFHGDFFDFVGKADFVGIVFEYGLIVDHGPLAFDLQSGAEPFRVHIEKQAGVNAERAEQLPLMHPFILVAAFAKVLDALHQDVVRNGKIAMRFLDALDVHAQEKLVVLVWAKSVVMGLIEQDRSLKAFVGDQGALLRRSG